MYCTDKHLFIYINRAYMGIQDFTKICLNNKLSKNEKVWRKDAKTDNKSVKSK